MDFILSATYNLLNAKDHPVFQAPQLIKQGESFHIIFTIFLLSHFLTFS